MTWQTVHLGPLTDLAARYLEDARAWCGPLLDSECARRLDENDVIAAMVAIKRARLERRPFTDVEQELVSRAEMHVRRGVQPPACCATIHASGRRYHQTLVSIADAGQGHLDVTLRDPELLDGVIVHHEVITRTGPDGVRDLELAPYRIIDIRLNGILRLHAADDVPVTVYAGRPNFPVIGSHAPAAAGWSVAAAYRADPVTPSHTAAATASAAFANGVADVKFSFDGLTASQAVDFMRRVDDAVDRRPDQQLSTQFNVFRPVIDDRDAAVGIATAEPAAIADLALDLTHAGGWDRVTLDSASHRVPSLPLMDVLGLATIAHWVARAHGLGLETYISGGMSEQHVRQATHAGVDGVGLGWCLHRCDADAGTAYVLDGESVRRVIAARNDAEHSLQGRAAQLLARLQATGVTATGSDAAGVITMWLQAMLSGEQNALELLIRDLGV
jgi:uncharacterized protein (UPF0264 family)